MIFVRKVMVPIGLAMTFFLAACGPTPNPTAPPSTPLPATELPAAPTEPIFSVALAGPQNAEKMTWIDGSTLVYIAPSQFRMGNGVGDAPEHTVTLDGYWIQQTKVTNRMYAQCVAVDACTPPTQELGGPVYSNPDYENHPVIGVTWDQSQAYCTWTQGRLPTEAEWEKAARGIDARVYPWGNDEAACDLLNSAYCIGHTTDVTAYDDGVSPYGLFDMAGNVFEWVGDWYGETYYSDGSPTNPTGPESGEYRVIRGSSFETDPGQEVSAIRHFGATVYHSRDLGFRCVVPQPKPLAPYCQSSAYIPTGVASAGECQLPFTDIRGQYCANGFGFTTMDIPDGAVYEIVDKGLECTEAVIDGQRRLTCVGPRAQETTNEITVCNPTCSTSPDITGAEPVCNSGYTLDSGGQCNYAPIARQVSVGGCPAGYILLESNGVKSCVLGAGADGGCPTGLYLDSLVGACMPPSGQSEVPYGIDNPGLAAQTYQGCAAGYAYDSTFQCCQPQTGGTYPGCAPGSAFNADLGACSPNQLKLSGPGCVTVSMNILKCSEPVDVCSKITSETRCLKNSYACEWDDQADICKLK
jgi:formylglycine-generating enzyme required for sulfatase activity